MQYVRSKTYKVLSTFLVALLALAAASGLQAASLYDTRCEDLTGSWQDAPAAEVLDVRVDRFTGTPPSSDTRRREQIEISAGLANALGIGDTEVGTSGVAAQVRVTLEAANPLTGLIPSANFTVAAIDSSDSGLRLRVWLPDDLAADGTFKDDDNGYFKLFGNQSPDDVFAAVHEATVHRLAPSATVVVDDGSVTEHEHFGEANSGSKYFRECVELRTDDRLAVLSPHGGGIETQISGELDTLLGSLEDLGYQPSVWEGAGQWGSGETFERWHVTSTQISEGSFPGYQQLATQAPYQYAVSLHGFTESEPAVVLGGQASRQVKCFLVDSIENRLYYGWFDGRGRHDGKITYKIFAPDGDPVDVVRESTGSGDDPQPLTGVDHLDGDSDDNIVNRLSPNPTGVRGHGGIQIELSGELRKDATLFHEFMRALAFALDSQIRLEPASDYCAQYE